MDQLFERKILPKLIQEEIDHMNSPIPTLTSCLEAFKKKKTLGPEDSTGEFCQTFNEEITPFL